MANFKTHIGFGVFVGVAIVVIGLIGSLFSSPESTVWIFLAVLVGSFLPDLDMDEGVPFQILFGLTGAGLGGFVFLNLYQAGERDIKKLVLLPALAFAAVRFGAGYIFERFTNHRGIFHSIPAAALFGLLTIWLLNLSATSKGQEIFLGLAVSLGYVGHLVLDEIYASVNLHGHSLSPKQSLGSALKFYSSSRIVSLLLYVIIFILAMNLPETSKLLKQFK